MFFLWAPKAGAKRGGAGARCCERIAMAQAHSAASLVAECTWLALATTDDHGDPAASYVPFACAGGAFVVALSGLAAHTRFLQARPEAAVLLVGVPADGDAFAAPRLSVAVRARYCQRGSSRSDAIWDALERRHGATAATLRALPDFATLQLEPLRGREIIGFASAGDLDGGSIARLLV